MPGGGELRLVAVRGADGLGDVPLEGQPLLLEHHDSERLVEQEGQLAGLEELDPAFTVVLRRPAVGLLVADQVGGVLGRVDDRLRSRSWWSLKSSEMMSPPKLWTFCRLKYQPKSPTVVGV